MAAMPAAASENTLGKLFGANLGEPQMQREARRYRQAGMQSGTDLSNAKCWPQGKDEAERKSRTGNRRKRGPQGQANRRQTLHVALGTARRKERLPRGPTNRLTGPDAGASWQAKVTVRKGRQARQDRLAR
jgi:hypothetical protein